jgi:hypothetical protein
MTRNFSSGAYVVRQILAASPNRAFAASEIKLIHTPTFHVTLLRLAVNRHATVK